MEVTVKKVKQHNNILTKNILLNFPAQEFRLTVVRLLCVPGYLLACGRSTCLLSLWI